MVGAEPVHGFNALSGASSIQLCRWSDRVLRTVLALADRRELLDAKRLVDARFVLRPMLSLADALDA